jgi:adenine deaminase
MPHDLARRLAVARGDEPADVVLSGGRVLSVFTGELLETDVAICGEHVAALGTAYEGRAHIDVAGQILLPGFIDGHMHLESTKLMIDEFARAALPWGTTTVVLDPHEIANVFGLDGVRAMLRSSDEVPIDVYVMVSSCVPASAFESNGATVDAEDIARFLAEEPKAIGLAEMMNFPAVVAGEADEIAKLEAAGGRHVDGHAPGLSGRALNAYVAAGVPRTTRRLRSAVSGCGSCSVRARPRGTSRISCRSCSGTGPRTACCAPMIANPITCSRTDTSTTRSARRSRSGVPPSTRS